MIEYGGKFEQINSQKYLKEYFEQAVDKIIENTELTYKVEIDERKVNGVLDCLFISFQLQ